MQHFPDMPIELLPGEEGTWLLTMLTPLSTISFSRGTSKLVTPT